MARSLRPPAASTACRAPRRSSTVRVSGLVYSPQGLSRGNADRSRSSTEKPSLASKAEKAEPAGPAPTTMASYSRGGDILDLDLCLLSIVHRPLADRGHSPE